MDLEKSNCNHGVTLDFDTENWAIKTNFTNYQNIENARVKCNLHFKQGTYTITYDAFGGSGAPESQTKTYGVDITLSSTTPTRTGYTFLGWSTLAGATSATYQAGATFSENANTTLYAVWKANTYTITYNANGGSGAPGSQTKTYGVNLTLSSTIPTRSNYTFLGWSQSSTATTPTYSAGSAFTSNANVTLYAVWGLTYIYNSGNQYTPNTGGWTYTRTFNTQKTEYGYNYANDAFVLGGTYMQWTEILENSDDGGSGYYGAGYVQTKNTVSLKNAKAININYTVTNAKTHLNTYPQVCLYLINSAGTTLKVNCMNIGSTNSNVLTFSTESSSVDMSSARIRISFATMAYGEQRLQIRIHSVYATY